MGSDAQYSKAPFKSGPVDIAIIGMSCIFPKAPDLATYWQNIVSKVDAISDPPPDWEAELFFDPGSESNDRTYCKRGGYLGDLAQFRPIDFGVMPKSIGGTDPDHFLGLRLTQEALADSGYLDRPFDRERCGVIVGRGTYIGRGFANQIQHCFVVDETIRLLRQLHPEYTPEELKKIKDGIKANLPPFTAEVAPSLVPNVMAGRIANRFNLMGPNYIVDAACASSLIAVEQAVNNLTTGSCDMVLAGGANASTTPPMLMLFCLLGALSREGQIRPFDMKADGTLLGEGYGMVVLKRLADAMRDGDRIYAVLKGLGSSSDGRALSVLAPRVEGEELALRRAYDSSGISPRTIGLIEAHGTGTAAGDLTEIQTLRRVLGDREGRYPHCAIGTVKSMISHLIPAAGIAGLIKTALALYHKTLPPTLKCEEPNPKFELEKTAFYINTETRPWIHGGPKPRRAAVNAFGFGGINAHAILEEAPETDPHKTVSLHRTWDSEVFILEAASRDELIGHVDRLNRFVSASPSVEMKDLAATVNRDLRNAPCRLGIVAASAADLSQKLAAARAKLSDSRCTRINDAGGIYFFEEPMGRLGKLAFLFPGEGSQYQNMLADLCLHFPEVRAWFDFMDRAFWDHPRGYLPSQCIFPPPALGGSNGAGKAAEALFEMDGAVEAVFTANQAMGALLGRLGIRPDAVLGHSTGEYSALLASGALEVDHEERLATHVRDLNRAYEDFTAHGGLPEAALLAVGTTDREALDRLVAESEEPLFVAMDNCPHQIVLCGTKKNTARAAEALQRTGAVCQALPFDRPYHTPLFEGFSEPLREFFGGLKIVRPKLPMYSCVTAAPYPEDTEEIRRLAIVQWASPVRFRETIEAMYADGVRMFVEVGPRGNLTAFVEDILRGRPKMAAASNLTSRSGLAQLHHMIAQLAAHGVSLKTDHLYAKRDPKYLTLDSPSSPSEKTIETAGTVKLASYLPGLRLSNYHPAARPSANMAAATVSPPLPPVGATQVPPVHPVPARSFVSVTAESTEAGASGHEVMSRPAGEGAEVVGEYFQTMEYFLEAQEEIIRTYLQNDATSFAEGRNGKSGGLVQSPRKPSTPSIESRAEVARPDFPLIDAILSLVPGESVVARREFRLEEDLFLYHHTIGSRTVSQDAGLTALPVIPLTVNMELMAEVASVLYPDHRLVGMREVRGYRWVGLDQGRVTLQISAKRRAGLPGIEVDVQVREDAGAAPDLSPATLIMEGTMLFAEAYPDPPSIETLELKGERPSRWHGEILYTDGMFHGPAFQAVVGVDRTGEDGVEATLRVLPTDTLFQSRPAPALVTDPVVLDAAGQVVGYWALENLTTRFNVFPFRLESLRIYRPNLAVDERLVCQARLTDVGEAETRSDIDLIGSNGGLWMRLTGWWDRRFEMPNAFYRFRITPLDVVLSRDWAEGLEQFRAPEAFRCMLLDGLPDELLRGGWMIWCRVLAHLILSRQEREMWHSLNLPEPRRIEWLLGRMAAKDAVRVWLKERHGLTVYPADIEIGKGPKGQPIPQGPWTADIPERPLLSLTHAGGIAAAVAGAAERVKGIGIDLERLSRFNGRFEADLLTQAEHDLLEGAPLSERLEWSVRTWCAKEAVGKALGSGVIGGPWALLVQSLDFSTGTVKIGLVGEMAAAFPDWAGRRLVARTGRNGDLIMATAWIGEKENEGNAG
jgi:acyl transferase domain-containing protein/phosphopantetheinyl transferase